MVDSMFIGLVKDVKNILVENGFEQKHMKQMFQDLHFTLSDIRTDFGEKFNFSFDKSKIKTPRYTTDNFDEHLKKIEYLKRLFSNIVRKYGYERIQTPTIEHTDIFKLTSVFAEDKSYVFKDKGDRELVLRPDINAPLSRVVVNNKSVL
jgi:threonyl-tRNA synthetase